MYVAASRTVDAGPVFSAVEVSRAYDGNYGASVVNSRWLKEGEYRTVSYRIVWGGLRSVIDVSQSENQMTEEKKRFDSETGDRVG